VSAPTSLLQGARAFARDQPRDALPKGYLWDINDFVPTLIDTILTGRGAWLWGCPSQGGGDFAAGILAPFTSGEQVLASTANGTLYQVDSLNPPFNLTSRGTVPPAIQNPVQLLDQTIWFDGTGATAPGIVGPTGGQTAAPGAPAVKVGAVWRGYVAGGGAPSSADTVWFSPPNTASTTWDANSFIRTAGPITGMAALRSILLVFHPGSTERIRGTIVPHTGDSGTRDTVLEPLFGREGTTEPRSICYWNENVIFANEHGVQLTDGSAIRNLISQGSISYFWRPLYQNKKTISASVFLDYYVVTVLKQDNSSVTLVCDLNKRQWFKFTNIAATCMFTSAGTTNMERFWCGIQGSGRLARLAPTFFPPLGGTTLVDDNGVPVLPNLETGWYRLGQEGRKRIRFAYLSYDVRAAAATPNMFDLSYIDVSPQDPTFTLAGSYPSTDRYQRFRTPVGKNTYGIAFRFEQKVPSTVTRIFDLAVDAHMTERGRV